MTDRSPAPLTRRELRMAERAAAGQSALRRTTRDLHPVPVVRTLPAGALPTPRREPADRAATAVSTASPDRPAAAAPRTRRELRAAERACTPPFTPSITVEAPPQARTRRGHAFSAQLSATTVAKSGVVLALSGALLVTGMSGAVSPSSPGLDDAAVRSAQQRSAAEAARMAENARLRADQAWSTRLSAAAAAHASAQRADAVEVALAAIETADVVAAQAQTVVDPATLAPLDTAVAELSTMIDTIREPVVLARGATPVDAPVGTAPDSASGPTEPVAESGAAEASEERPETQATPAPKNRPAPRLSAESAPRHDGEDPAASRTGDREKLAAEVPPADAADAAALDTDDVSADGTAGPVDLPALLTGTPEELADLAALEIETSEALIVAAEQIRTLTQQVEQTTAEVIARQEAERAAAAELARKIAVVAQSPNGDIPTDLLCAPAFAPGQLLRCDAAQALERLNAEYRAAFGRDLAVNSTYRSYAGQVSARQHRGYLAATPGTSNHGHAVAVDFDGFGGVGQFSDADYLWMKKHAPAHGWVHPQIMEPGGGGPQEPWHWEFGTA